MYFKSHLIPKPIYFKSPRSWRLLPAAAALEPAIGGDIAAHVRVAEEEEARILRSVAARNCTVLLRSRIVMAASGSHKAAEARGSAAIGASPQLYDYLTHSEADVTNIEIGSCHGKK